MIRRGLFDGLGYKRLSPFTSVRLNRTTDLIDCPAYRVIGSGGNYAFTAEPEVDVLSAVAACQPTLIRTTKGLVAKGAITLSLIWFCFA